MRTMINPVQPLAVCSLLLLSLPSISAELDDMKIMSKMGWPAAAASAAAAAIGNHTDTDNQSHHANEIAANILGYTLVGIMVLMFFFAVVTFGRSCCIQCKNVSFWVLLFLCCVQSCFSASTLSSFLIINSFIHPFLPNLQCCIVFSRHGCKGCCRYMRGRRPEGGDAAAGILNEVIFDQEREEPEDEGEAGLGRGLLTDA